MKLEITREWLAATLADGDDSECAAGDPTLFKERTMSTTMRAKMYVTRVEQLKDSKGELYQETLSMAAIAKNQPYDETGLDEDNTFAKFTPSASFTVAILNPALWGKFEPGQKYYVDFTPAPQ